MEVCKHYKSKYVNGELVSSRCIKLNQDVSLTACEDCSHHSEKESEEIPE